MGIELQTVFDFIAAGNTDPLISLVEEKSTKFKSLSYEEKYQILVQLAVALGDPGMTGDVDTFDNLTLRNVQDGMTSYANQDELENVIKTLNAEGLENPTHEQSILRLRIDYRGEAPPADEPLKLTLLYDHFRTQGWRVKPEHALIFLELSKEQDKKWGNQIDQTIVGWFGKPTLTRA